MSMSSSSGTTPRLHAKSLSVSKSPAKSRSRLSLASERSNITLKPILERRRGGRYEDPSKAPSVVRFVYSEAVERGFRREYRSTEFGPFSAFPHASCDPYVEVAGLPDIYRDFLCVKQAAEHNSRYIARLREELGDRYDEVERVDWRPAKAPRVAMRNSLAIAKLRGGRGRRGSGPKLPPIAASGAHVEQQQMPAAGVAPRLSPYPPGTSSSSRGPSRSSPALEGDSFSRRSSLLSDDTTIDLGLSEARSRTGTYVTESAMSSTHTPVFSSMASPAEQAV